MDQFRGFFSSMLWYLRSGFHECWNESLNSNGPWSWLKVSRLGGVPIDTWGWCHGSQCGYSMLWHSISWILVHPAYGIVIVHYRLLGGAGLILSFSWRAFITWIYVLVWVDSIPNALFHFVWQLLDVLDLFFVIWPSALLAGSVDRTKLSLSLYMSGNSPQGEQLNISLMRIRSKIYDVRCLYRIPRGWTVSPPHGGGLIQLCCYPGFRFMLLYSGLSRCFDFVSCRPLSCFNLSFVLQLPTATSCSGVGEGVVWGFYLCLVQLKDFTCALEGFLPTGGWCWWHYSKYCMGQHVNMPRLPLWRFDQPLLGGWNSLYLLFVHEAECLIVEKVINTFVASLSWTFPYLLLSLSQADKHALEHVSIITCCCGHLAPLPRLRDEVKEECPIVYDENLSETLYFCLLHWLPPLFCSYVAAHQHHGSVPDLLAELRTTLQVVGVKQSSWAAATASSLNYYFGLYLCLRGMYSWQFSVPFSTRGHLDQLYYYPGYALSRLYGTQTACKAVMSRCVLPSPSYCSCSFTSNVEPHLSVIGPCLMAIALHLTMLGTVYLGLDQHVHVLGPCYNALDQHLKMLSQNLVRFITVFIMVPWNGMSYLYEVRSDENPSMECAGC